MKRYLADIFITITMIVVMAMVTSVICLAILIPLDIHFPLVSIMLISVINQIVLEMYVRYTRELLRTKENTGKLVVKAKVIE